MDLPSLRHFRNDGLFTVSSDPVEALVGEAWVPAVYTDKGWATADGASLLTDITEWRAPCPNTPAPPNPKSQRPKRKAVRSDNLGTHYIPAG
jgi:hypothetical protein